MDRELELAQNDAAGEDDGSVSGDEDDELEFERELELASFPLPESNHILNLYGRIRSNGSR